MSMTDQAQRLAMLDQIAAAVRDADRPLTVRELTDMGAGRGIWILPRRAEDGCGSHAAWHDDCYECRPAGCVRFMSGVSQGQMEQLARRGLVKRSKAGRRVYWSWCGERVDVDAERLGLL